MQQVHVVRLRRGRSLTRACTYSLHTYLYNLSVCLCIYLSLSLPVNILIFFLLFIIIILLILLIATDIIIILKVTAWEGPASLLLPRLPAGRASHLEYLEGVGQGADLLRHGEDDGGALGLLVALQDVLSALHQRRL